MNDSGAGNDPIRLLRLLGLAAKAGKVITGTNMVCETLSAGKKVFLVIEASDTSENTHKRISDKCRYYGAKKFRVDVPGGKLGEILGKSGEIAVVAITDENFAHGIEPLLV